MIEQFASDLLFWSDNIFVSWLIHDHGDLVYILF